MKGTLTEANSLIYRRLALGHNYFPAVNLSEKICRPIDLT